MKKYACIIILFAVSLGSCSPKAHAKRDSKKIKSEKTITVGQTFLMVASFMLGYGLTNEYLKKE